MAPVWTFLPDSQRETQLMPASASFPLLPEPVSPAPTPAPEFIERSAHDVTQGFPGFGSSAGSPASR